MLHKLLINNMERPRPSRSEQDALWNKQRTYNRMWNVNHSGPVRVNGGLLIEGQPRLPTNVFTYKGKK